VFAAFAAHAQPVFRHAAELPQGGTLRIDASGLSVNEGLTATLFGITVPIYPSGNGAVLGLIGIPAIQAPGPGALVIRDKSGAQLYHAEIKVLDAGFQTQDVKKTTQMQNLKATPGEQEAVQEFLKTESPEKFFIEPFAVPVAHCATSPFGVQRLHDGKPTGRFHHGLDLRAPQGAPIHAAAAGVVKISRMYSLHGGTVGIDHGQGVVSLYLHQSRVVAKVGTNVRPGQIIGYSGATGFANGAHLHWEIRVHGEAVNPIPWTTGIKACQ
jgi:murein DD-endopeptidase MepM/ murein hydrolase activator NlpD